MMEPKLCVISGSMGGFRGKKALPQLVIMCTPHQAACRWISQNWGLLANSFSFHTPMPPPWLIFQPTSILYSAYFTSVRRAPRLRFTTTVRYNMTINQLNQQHKRVNYLATFNMLIHLKGSLRNGCRINSGNCFTLSTCVQTYKTYIPSFALAMDQLMV